MSGVSIIIPSYNSQKTIKRVLDAIFSQLTKVDYEVIVVDSSPTDEIDSIVKSYDNLSFIKLTSQASASYARNLGVKKSKNNILLFLDSDVFIATDVIEKIYSYFAQGYKVIGGSFTLDRSEVFSINTFLEFAFFFSESLPNNPNRARKNLPSGLLAIDKKIFTDLGPFNEYGRNEDTALTEKISRAGYILHYCPDINAKLFQQVTFNQFLNKCKINGINFPYLRLGDTLTLSNRVMLFFALPLIALAKFILMSYRNIAYRNCLSEQFLFVLLSPLIFLGILFWCLGANVTVFSNNGIGLQR